MRALLISNKSPQNIRDTFLKVTWVFDEDHFKDIPTGTEEKSRPQAMQECQLDILQLLEDEEDEMEYDIVNIDTDLLRLPRLFMNEDFIKKPRYLFMLGRNYFQIIETKKK